MVTSALTKHSTSAFPFFEKMPAMVLASLALTRWKNASTSLFRGDINALCTYIPSLTCMYEMTKAVAATVPADIAFAKTVQNHKNIEKDLAVSEIIWVTCKSVWLKHRFS